jgi:hypothetical protein
MAIILLVRTQLMQSVKAAVRQKSIRCGSRRAYFIYRSMQTYSMRFAPDH